ncbi:MAG: hypothetical protein QNJ38_10250 [Prochloraceae cyanobacterium]|nr:hypothetical protein [Prochloraceae cyanobacterium]
MNDAIDKTISFIFLISIGSLLKKNISQKEHLEGVKLLIFNTALPATILLALLHIKIELNLVFLPVLALSFNLMMLGLCRLLLPVLGFGVNTSRSRTMMMLIPSLAPGLSCFPYILEYLGEQPLAWAALADLGNKLFVVVGLYLLAINWYYKRKKTFSWNLSFNLKLFFTSLFKQPTNLVIVIGLVLIFFGLNFDNLPFFIKYSVERTSNMMTPLMLIFIGLVVKFRRHQVTQIASLLFFRAGIGLCFSALLIAVLPLNSVDMKILAVVFPLSSCSFLSYANMYAVNMLKDSPSNAIRQFPVFDLDLALTLLAISLPFSTISILSVCVAKNFFTSSINLLMVGTCLILIAVIFCIVNRRLKVKHPQPTAQLTIKNTKFTNQAKKDNPLRQNLPVGERKS